MEEYNIPHDLQEMDNMPWLDPDPGLLEALDVNNGVPFFPGAIDVTHDFYWPPSPEKVSIDSLHQSMDAISEPISYGTPAAHYHEPQFDSILPDHPGPEQLSANFLVYEQGDGSFTYSFYPDIRSLFVGGPDSSTISEGVSPLSETMLASLPTSPVALLGSIQAPLQRELLPGPNCPVDLHARFSPSIREIESTLKARPGELQRRRRGSTQQVGRSRPPKREVRMKERPEACEYCPKRFPFRADLTKHVKARHCEEKETHLCTVSGCSKVYTRSDRLYRHGVTKHGWPRGGERGRRRAANQGRQN